MPPLRRALLSAFFVHALSTLSIAQNYVTLTPKRASLLVGQDAEIAVAFDAAVTYDAQISVYCLSKQSSIHFVAFVSSGTRNFDLSYHIPADQIGGLYDCSQLTFSPAPKKSEGRIMKAPSVFLKVASALPPSILGGKCAPFLNSQQKDLLAEQSREIQSVITTYKAKMTDARPRLRGNRVQLIDLLRLQEDRARKLYARLQEEGPADSSGGQEVFFNDLRANLEDAMGSLQATLGKSATAQTDRPQLIYTRFIQAVPRERHYDPETKGLRVLEYASWVYSKVAGSGDFHFTVTIHSTPKGAMVFYKRGANAFEDYGDTDFDDAQFPYSEHYTFKVEMTGYDSWQRDADLGLNANPKFNVVLTCTRK